jgi:hypothetical protein
MIEAWFEKPDTTIIPALVPNDEIRELARMSDIPLSDLFCIDIPGGATNRARICVLIPQASLQSLYASSGWLGQATCVFKWRESSTAQTFSMNVMLLPPRPLFMVAGGAGVAVVEATDIRYLWQRRSTIVAGSDVFTPQMFSSDGRYTDRVNNVTSLLELVQEIRTALLIGGGAAALETYSTTGYTPNSALLQRIANHDWPNQASMALFLDTVLALSGYALLWNPQATALQEKYTLKRIDNDGTLLVDWMTGNKRAAASGLEPPSNPATAGSEPLYDLWVGTDAMQFNRFPQNVDIIYPLRACEGQTHYPNNRALPPSPGVRFPEYAEIHNARALGAARNRREELVGIVNESRAIPNQVAVPPGWSTTATSNEIAVNAKRRIESNFGKVVWAGWPYLPLGVYRLSTFRFSLGERNGQLVPITITECREDDWLLGPSGLLPNNPRDIIMGTGMVQARRLSSGTVHVNVAEPMCRMFPAKITGFTRCAQTGNGFWQWEYDWEEVEPDPLTDCPAGVDIGIFARSSGASGLRARNLCEAANIYVAPGDINNVIAPGVRQSDYDPSQIIVEALPIMLQTIVMMCEQFPTNSYPVQYPPAIREYWFSMPDAVKTICQQV